MAFSRSFERRPKAMIVNAAEKLDKRCLPFRVRICIDGIADLGACPKEERE